MENAIVNIASIMKKEMNDMYDDIVCPNCKGSKLTLIEKYTDNGHIKYVYLCRDCNKTFTVVIGIANC